MLLDDLDKHRRTAQFCPPVAHVLILEADPAQANRLSAAFTQQRITIATNPQEAAQAIGNRGVHIGVASSAVFRDNLIHRDLRLIPWIVLVDSIDDELAVHHNAPEINATFLVKDEQQRYFDLLPLRIRAIASRERVLATITSQFPGTFAYWDNDERCQFANSTYRQWFDVAPSDLLGTSLRDLLGTMYSLNEPYIRGALRGEPQRFRRSIPRPGGGPPRYVIITYTPDIQDGIVRGFVALVTDMSEEYKLQVALLEREHRWATLFEILPVGAAIFDNKGAVVEMNPAIKKILGIDRQGIEQGKHEKWVYIDADGRTMTRSELPSVRTFVEQKIVGPLEIGIRREDQSTVWTSVIAAPFPNEDKAVVITRDTTLEKAHTARFEAMVGASPIPYALIDRRGTITYSNPAFCKTFGYTHEEVPTLERWRLLAYPDPTYRAWVINEWQARFHRSKMDKAVAEPLELTIRTKDGSERFVVATAVSLENSLTDGHLVVLVDITERRRAERQLEESRRLASLGALAGGIAHDFNNLLTPILANVDVALADLPSTGTLHGSLSEVRAAARRAADLVRQILAVSRPGDDSKTRVDIVPLVDEVVHLLRASLPSNISIKTEIESRVSSLFANPSRIHQVILNLATNARDAMGTSGGILRITVNRTDRKWVKLSVSDTGTGIAPELMDRVYEPYFTTKTSSGGTGLGLATVRAIVTSLGGTIAIQSEMGKGTTVDVLFPIIEESRPPSKSGESSSSTKQVVIGKGQHILIVDDEPMVVRAAGRMLTRLGYRVTAVNGPEDGIVAYRGDESIDAVLTDYSMPGMTGLELAKTLFEIRPTCILLATGLAEHLTEDNLREAHIHQLLMKPYGMTTLSEAFATALSAQS